MDTYTLVVSNPPHEKEVDAPRAAPCFGLTAVDVGMKANYVAPEIWLAGTDRSKLEDAAQTLREAGLNVMVVAGRDLANIPAPARVKYFSFTDTHLVADLEDSKVGLPYDAGIVTVFCKAPEGSPTELTRPTGSALLDMYGSRKGELLRISFVQEVLDFSGGSMLRQGDRSHYWRRYRRYESASGGGVGRSQKVDQPLHEAGGVGNG